MTAQIADCLTFQGQDYRLFAEPLSLWLNKRRNRNIRFQRISTACWRGYVARWEVVDDRLFLTNISGHFQDGRELSVADLFPDDPELVLADWVTGTVRCPFGARLKYSHAGYSSIYEHDLILRFQDGVLMEYRTVRNEPPPPDE
ncbi:MAG: hypothetical protein ACOYNZ_17415, partial [Rhodoferax sp.]